MTEIDKEKNKVNLNKLVKLSVIAFALAGIYYFVSVLPLQSTSNTLFMKQKCQQVGEKLYQETIKAYEGKGMMESPMYLYSKKLNTCIYVGGIYYNDSVETNDHWVKDSLSMDTIELCHHNQKMSNEESANWVKCQGDIQNIVDSAKK